MDWAKTLQDLLDGTASEDEIHLLRQALVSGEISIGGNVNQSVIIIGSGNTVELTPAALDRLNARPMLGNLDRDLTGEEIASGLRRLDKLLLNRAPILLPHYKEQVGRLRPTLKTEIKSLSEPARRERLEALAAINSICVEALDVSFNGLCLGEAAPDYDARSPFRGLESFHPEDSEFFFGREALTRKFVAQIQTHPFLAVLGASGSGKSSLVMAGVIPALDSDYAIFRPGMSPLGELESARGKSLIVVDQFEELFTLTRDESTREEFIARLLDESTRARIILTLRSDFLGEVGAYRTLSGEIQNHLEIVPPMDMDELRRAMEGQAGVVGLRFEADLSQQILDDVEGEPGAMPLLQHALWELWNRRHGRNLRASEYRAFGGVKQAITSTAEKIYADCSKPEQDQVRDIFLRLTRLDEGDERRDTRRRVSLDDLIPFGRNAASITLLLDKLANARLIVKTVNDDETKVEVAHEALIRHWERLRGWVNQNRDQLRLLENISEDAEEWENAGMAESALPQHGGSRLEDALKLHNRLNRREQNFLAACVALKKKEERRKRIVLIGISTAAFFFALLGAFGWYQANIAKQETQKARQQELSALALANIVNERSDLALLLSVQAYRQGANMDSFAAHRALLTTAQGTNKIEGFLWDANAENVRAVVYLDAHTVIYGTSGGRVVFFDLVESRPIGAALDFSGSIKSIDLSRDGKTLMVAACQIATSSVADACKGEIKLFDVQSREPLGGPDGTGNIGSRVIFNTDGGAILFGDGQRLRTWDVRTHEWRTVFKAESDIYSLAFNSQGNLLALGLAQEQNGNNIQILQTDTMQTLKMLHILSSNVYVVAFHPTKGILASGIAGDQVILWDTDRWEEIATLTGHLNPILDIAFSADGTTMASASYGMIRLFNFEGKQPREKDVLGGYGYSIGDIAFSPDGQTVAGATKQSVVLWSVAEAPLFRVLSSDDGRVYQHKVDHIPPIEALVFSVEGDVLVSADAATQLVYHFMDGQPAFGQNLSQDETTKASVFALNTGATLLAYALNPQGAAGCVLKIFSPVENEAVRDIPCEGMPNAVAVSPDGKFAAMATLKGDVFLWNVSDSSLVHTLKTSGSVYALGFDPQSRILASSGCAHQDNPCTAGEIILWNVSSGNEKSRLYGHSNYVRSIAFSPDGAMLASGGRDANIIFWNVETGTPISTPLDGHASYVNALTFSPDGKMLASASSDLHVILWDVQRQQRIGDALVGHTSAITALAFNHNGTVLVSGDNHGNILVWDIEPESLAGRLCAKVRRNLTRAEWDQYIGDALPYQEVCPNLPIEPELTVMSTP